MSELQMVDGIYQVSATATLDVTAISHTLFRDFSLGVDRLRRSLGDSVEDESWAQVLAPLRRYRFLLASAPIPFNEPALLITRNLERVATQLLSLHDADPRSAELLSKVLATGLALQSCPDNPIRDAILRTFPKGVRNGAVLVKDARLVKPIQVALRQYPTTCSLSVVTAGQLKGDHCYSFICVCGAAKWFPDFVFTAPRASAVMVFRYDWIRDVVPAPPRFIEQEGEGKTPSAIVPAASERPTVEADQIMPTIDWVALQRRGHPNPESESESVPARVAVLEGDYGVFLEDDEGSMLLTVDLYTDVPIERVRRVRTKELAVGMFVVLRTSGGGDYVLPVANGLLGKTSTQLRNLQKEWKALLREKVADSNLFEISIQLIELGSTRANETNLRNWMSPRSIKTYDPQDFAAIMRLIGLDDRRDEYWNAMSVLSRAHQQSGQRIRRSLFRRLQELDLSQLERDGLIDISLPDVDAGALTAFRVIGLAPALGNVTPARLNHPFPLGELDATYHSG